MCELLKVRDPGRVLKDEDALSTYKIQTAHTIHMVKGAARSGPSAQASTPQQLPTMQAGQNPHDPLTQLNGPMGFGLMAGFNPFQEMGLNPNDPNMVSAAHHSWYERMGIVSGGSAMGTSGICRVAAWIGLRPSSVIPRCPSGAVLHCRKRLVFGWRSRLNPPNPLLTRRADAIHAQLAPIPATNVERHVQSRRPRPDHRLEPPTRRDGPASARGVPLRALPADDVQPGDAAHDAPNVESHARIRHGTWRCGRNGRTRWTRRIRRRGGRCRWVPCSRFAVNGPPAAIRVSPSWLARDVALVASSQSVRASLQSVLSLPTTNGCGSHSRSDRLWYRRTGDWYAWG